MVFLKPVLTNKKASQFRQEAFLLKSDGCRFLAHRACLQVNDISFAVDSNSCRVVTAESNSTRVVPNAVRAAAIGGECCRTA